MSSQCILIGNYGVGNLGDDALQRFFLEAYPTIEWKSVSANPAENELHRLPCGLRSLFSSWLRTLREIRRSKGVVFGGGSLFTDAESLKACLVWGVHALAAQVFRKPIILAFQGIGPFRSQIGEVIARWVVSKASYISVRDSLSYERIEQWKKKCHVVQSFDPVFACIHPTEEKQSMNSLTIIPRHNSGEKLLSVLECIFEEGEYEQVKILLMHPDNAVETEYASTLSLQIESECEVIPLRSLEELADNIADSDLVLTERYHGAIAALALGVPVEIVSQKEGDKLSSLVSIELVTLQAELEEGITSLGNLLLQS